MKKFNKRLQQSRKDREEVRLSVRCVGDEQWHSFTIYRYQLNAILEAFHCVAKYMVDGVLYVPSHGGWKAVRNAH